VVLLLGLAVGYLGYKLIASIDHYQVEVLISRSNGRLYLYSLYTCFWTSCDGCRRINYRNQGKKLGMSDTAEYIDKFWELIDEILNAVLFVLIGLELLIIKRTKKNSISFHHSFISNFSNTIYICLYTIHCCAIKSIKKTLLILTWGGLRGRISITCLIYCS
jgi:CPA1 family monovalent cation:H+ antiporter